MTLPNNTHKNWAVTAFINRFALTCLLASTAVLTACIGTGGGGPGDIHDFSARSFVLPGSFSLEASTSTDGAPLSSVALRYLNSINFQGYQRAGEVFGYTVLGDFNNDPGLGADDGVLIIQTRGEDGAGGHVFAGRFETTDVGAELALSEATPTATFRGEATVVLVHARNGGLFGTNDSLRGRLDFTNLELTANFDGNTLTGSGSNPSGERLSVDGRFNGKSITGNVTATFVNPDILEARANQNTITSNLTGQIGEHGAVGAFNSHLARGRPSDYALAGGFVVKPIPASP